MFAVYANNFGAFRLMEDGFISSDEAAQYAVDEYGNGDWKIYFYASELIPLEIDPDEVSIREDGLMLVR